MKNKYLSEYVDQASDEVNFQRLRTVKSPEYRSWKAFIRYELDKTKTRNKSYDKNKM